MANTGRKNIRILIVIIIGSLLLVAVSAFARYIYAKDYYFQIEAPCNTGTQTCYIRSCDEYCPPNGLESYNVYQLKAMYFDQCTNNSCENVCTPYNKNICTPIPCEASDEQVCSDSTS